MMLTHLALLYSLQMVLGKFDIPQDGNPRAKLLFPTTILKTPTSTTTSAQSSAASTATVAPSSITEKNCNAAGVVCLVGGIENVSGNVMVGGAPVCDDSWELVDGHVACKQLGYARAKEVTRESRYGNVSSKFAMDNVKCRGDELRLTDCLHSTEDDCGPGEGAGVVCDTRDYSDIVSSTCFEMDISYTFGDSIDQNGSISSVAECQAHCQALSDCTHFTFYPDLFRCYRKRGNAKTFKEGAVSGPRNCSAVDSTTAAPPDCFQQGIGYNYGEYLDYFTAEDARTCQGRCGSYRGCEFFSYYTSNNECYMKTSSSMKRPNPDVISGPKSCDGKEVSRTGGGGGDAAAVAKNGGPSADDLRGSECHLPGRVCLFGGGSSSEGNVHVGGKPVCDDSWDLVDAAVVCRQLGYYGVSRATKESRYGTVSANFAMDNVGCSGTEVKLLDCPHSKQDDCGASEGAGVVCDTRPKEEIEAERAILTTCFEEGVSYYYGEYLDFDAAESPLACQKHCIAHTDCSHFTFYPASNRCYRKQGGAKRSIEGAISGPRNCSDPNGGGDSGDNVTISSTAASSPSSPLNCSSPGVVCLVGGSKPNEGNVFVGNKPVCDDDWSLVNANVACRQLGFSGALAMTKESRFGPVPNVFAMDQVNCEGSEERLIDCRHSPIDDCGAGEGAGAICGTRSPDEERALQAACFRKGISFSPGNWIDYEVVPSPLDCQTHCRSHAECRFFTFYRDTNKCYRKTTNEPTQRNEAVSGPRDCPALDIAASLSSSAAANSTKPSSQSSLPLLPPSDCNVPGVVCLKGGNTPDEGNVFVGGRPVCDDSWDTRDGRVVCRELGYVDVIRTYSESQFGKVPASFAMDNVACTGYESSLKLCKHTAMDDCGPGEGAGVKCDNRSELAVPERCRAEQQVCLLGGAGDHEGNVYLAGRPVCDDDWSISNGHVVCQQLGFAEVEAIKKESHFGIVPSAFIMTGVQCLGTESALHLCNHSQDVNCNRQEGAGVVCKKQLLSAGQQDTDATNALGVFISVGILLAVLAVGWVYRERIKHLLIREVMIQSSGSSGLLNVSTHRNLS